MQTLEHFARRFGGVSSVAFLTYLGEYMSFIIVLVFLSDKLTVTFGLGLYGFGLIGTISGVYLVVSGLIAVPIGHLCDKYGRRLFTILGSLLGAIALFSLVGLDALNGLLEFAIGIGAALTMLGVGHGTYTASTLAYTGDMAATDELGKPYGLVEGAEFAAFAFGPAIGGVVAFAFGRIPTFLVSGSLLLVASLISFFFMPEVRNSPPIRAVASDLANGRDKSVSHSASWGDFALSLKDSVVGVTVLTTFVSSLSFTAFFFYVPLYAYTLRGSIPVFAFLYPTFASLMAGTGVVSMVPLGHLEDATKRRMPVLVTGLVAGAASLGFVFFSPSLASLVVASIVFGISLAMVRVSQLVILAERTKLESRAAVMGTNHAVEHVAYGTGAIVGGVFVALFGLANTFRNLALLLLLAGVGFLVFALRKKLE